MLSSEKLHETFMESDGGLSRTDFDKSGADGIGTACQQPQLHRVLVFNSTARLQNTIIWEILQY